MSDARSSAALQRTFNLRADPVPSSPLIRSFSDLERGLARGGGASGPGGRRANDARSDEVALSDGGEPDAVSRCMSANPFLSVLLLPSAARHRGQAVHHPSGPDLLADLPHQQQCHRHTEARRYPRDKERLCRVAAEAVSPLQALRRSPLALGAVNEVADT